MKIPILCIVNTNINSLNRFKNYSGIIKEPTILFSSIYLIQNYREIAASYYIYQIDLNGKSLQYWKDFSTPKLHKINCVFFIYKKLKEEILYSEETLRELLQRKIKIIYLK